MGFMDALKGFKDRLRFQDAEERKMYDSMLQKERMAANELAAKARKEELLEMARMEALPREQRVAMKLQNAREGAVKLYKGAKAANKKATKFQKKLGFDSGLIGQTMKGGSGGQLGDAMQKSAGMTRDKMRMAEKGKKITITFDR